MGTDTLIYHKTNENVESIIAGLNPCNGDFIAAVGGSGCQAFELVRRGARVRVYDINPAQIEYIEARLSDLESIERKRINVNKPGDIFKLINKVGGFNKCYLSNALSWLIPECNDYEEARKKIFVNLQNISDHLPIGGLIYVSDHRRLSSITRDSASSLDRYGFIPSNLTIDEKLSRAAQDSESLNESIWFPAVYRVVS